MFTGQFLMANFKSFCSRMWLDHCDENKAPLCITYTKEEYIKRNWIWLLDKYSKEVEEENEPTEK